MQMKDIIIRKDEVRDCMLALNKRKAMGPDQISGWMLSECAEELSFPLTEMFNKSLSQGKLPEVWKAADIVPIYKKGPKEDANNYRPVSLTSVVVKLLEKLIRKYWICHLEENNLLSNCQFGFRSNRSCVSNLLSFYDRVIDITQERDGWADCVFLDFKKAFDKVPHKRLLYKLEMCGGITGGLLKWMKNFLTGRKMRTVIRGKYSSWSDVTSGVPQGSVLAPVMFLIFINDLALGTSSYTNMFADDAKLVRKVVDNNCCKMLQDDINKLYEWSQVWKMEFNIDKCHVMEMGEGQGRPHGEYSMGGIRLQKSESEKDLGVVVNSRLDPGDHINNLVKKAYSWWANIRVAFKFLNEEMVKIFITQFLRPSLEYAAVVWNPHMIKHITKLEKIQRVITRWVPGLKNLQYEDRLRHLGIPSLAQRRERGDMIALFRCVHGMDYIDQTNFVLPAVGRTRGHDYKLLRRRARKDVRKFGFPDRLVEKWNKLPNDLVCAQSIQAFKVKYDKLKADGTLRE